MISFFWSYYRVRYFCLTSPPGGFFFRFSSKMFLFSNKLDETGRNCVKKIPHRGIWEQSLFLAFLFCYNHGHYENERGTP